MKMTMLFVIGNVFANLPCFFKVKGVKKTTNKPKYKGITQLKKHLH